MRKPVIAVVSFPGNNCEVESLRAIENSGMTPLYFRWNDDRAKLKDVDGYFLVGGFSYEDRGRSGMVAARDPLLEYIGREAEEGKVVIGNCNGAQILVESGLVPLDHGLKMSLARNVIETGAGFEALGFLSEWVWITPACPKDRCATSGWDGTTCGEHGRSMHLPIAHGEGRFTTKDKDVIAELKKNGQLAFAYCDAEGSVSDDPIVTPNGSMFSAAGICNPAGNVVALMPHPERTPNGKPYFDSLRTWIESNGRTKKAGKGSAAMSSLVLGSTEPGGLEVFIDTIIVNNEERTVEQAAKKYAPTLRLKQWKYVRTSSGNLRELLADITLFNANKERAFVRKGNAVARWNNDTKAEQPLTEDQYSAFVSGMKLLRRDLPDTGSTGLGKGGMSGVCYQVDGIADEDLRSRQLLEVFANPHASELTVLR